MTVNVEKRFEFPLFQREKPEEESCVNFKRKVVWKSAFNMTLLHVFALHGLYLVIRGQVMWRSVMFSCFLYVISMLGITAGAHRLWSHRSYKAKMPLRVILMIFNTIAFQVTVLHNV